MTRIGLFVWGANLSVCIYASLVIADLKGWLLLLPLIFIMLGILLVLLKMRFSYTLGTVISGLILTPFAITEETLSIASLNGIIWFLIITGSTSLIMGKIIAWMQRSDEDANAESRSFIKYNSFRQGGVSPYNSRGNFVTYDDRKIPHSYTDDFPFHCEYCGRKYMKPPEDNECKSCGSRITHIKEQ